MRPSLVSQGKRTQLVYELEMTENTLGLKLVNNAVKKERKSYLLLIIHTILCKWSLCSF